LVAVSQTADSGLHWNAASSAAWYFRIKTEAAFSA